MNDFELEQELKELAREIASNPRRGTREWTELFFRELCKEKGTISGGIDIYISNGGGREGVST